MRRVVFSGSMTLINGMIEWAGFLNRHGIKADVPVPGIETERWQQLSEENRRAEIRGHLEEHTSFIDKSDVLFVYNVNGRIGVSVTMEIGYAIAKHKEIYAFQPDADRGRDIVFKGYCSSPGQLLDVLQNGK